MQSRTRGKDVALHGGRECEGDANQQKECSTVECPGEWWVMDKIDTEMRGEGPLCEYFHKLSQGFERKYCFFPEDFIWRLLINFLCIDVVIMECKFCIFLNVVSVKFCVEPVCELVNFVYSVVSWYHYTKLL
jgi:hypothetical protein